MWSFPSGTTHSESKSRKNPENQRFSGFFLFLRHRRIRQKDGSSRNAGAFVKNDGSLMLKFKRIVLRAGR